MHGKCGDGREEFACPDGAPGSSRLMREVMGDVRDGKLVPVLSVLMSTIWIGSGCPSDSKSYPFSTVRTRHSSPLPSVADVRLVFISSLRCVRFRSMYTGVSYQHPQH